MRGRRGGEERGDKPGERRVRTEERKEKGREKEEGLMKGRRFNERKGNQRMKKRGNEG